MQKEYPEWVKIAENFYNQGMSYKDIALQVNKNRKTVSSYLRKLGYKSNPKYVRIVDPKKLQKYDYSYAETLFETIDTEEKAYWLGFLYADGYIDDSKNVIELALKEEDYIHLEKFRNFWHMNNKPIIKKIKNIYDKKYIGYRFFISNKKIKNDLIKLGCGPSKTFILKYPNKNQVPIELQHHFIRGYFDGDGCITGHRTSKISLEILGTEDFLNGYIRWTNISRNKLYSFNHSNIKRIIYSGKNAIKILDRIYDNAHIFLDRKFEKYLYFRRLISNAA